jgi:hypothetical protein
VALLAGESALKAAQQRLAEDDLDAARKELARYSVYVLY